MFDYIKHARRIFGRSAAAPNSELEFFESAIEVWKNSRKRRLQLTGARYYAGDHDILSRQRMAIGRDGTLHPVANLPNNKIVDNQYAIFLDQKTNYSFGKPFIFDTKNTKYKKHLSAIFDRRFICLLKELGADALRGGIAWLYVFYNENNELDFKRFLPHEVLPIWLDSRHTRLECVVRAYHEEALDGSTEDSLEKVEIYTSSGVRFFCIENGNLLPDSERPAESYLSFFEDGDRKQYNWEKIPIIPFKYNAEEIPLIKKVKTEQDAVNEIHSDFRNDMQENVAGGGIMSVKNYGGENPGELRHNIMTYRMFCTTSTQDMPGGIDVIKIDINPENYKAELELKKIALMENAMGFDAKTIRSNAPSQMNIKSLYSNTELDANSIEAEFKSSFENLLWFINVHLHNTQYVDFSIENVEISFNRDMLMNESEIIRDISSSAGVLSLRTQIENHPMVSDTEAELELIHEERREQTDIYESAFPRRGEQAADGDESADEV